MARSMKIDVSRLGAEAATTGTAWTRPYYLFTGEQDMDYVKQVREAILSDPTQDIKLVNFPPVEQSSGSINIIKALCMDIELVVRLDSGLTRQGNIVLAAGGTWSTGAPNPTGAYAYIELTLDNTVRNDSTVSSFANFPAVTFN